MKLVFLFILLSISLTGHSQGLPEFKMGEESTWTNGSTPKVLNLKEIKEQTKYPDSAKKNKIEGSVIVKLLIDESGNVQKIAGIKGDSIFYEATKDACLKLKFSPAYEDSKPIACRVYVPFKFTIPEKIDITSIDSNSNKETFHRRPLSIFDVNSGLLLWTIFIFSSPFLAIALVIFIMRKRKHK